MTGSFFFQRVKMFYWEMLLVWVEKNILRMFFQFSVLFCCVLPYWKGSFTWNFQKEVLHRGGFGLKP